MDLGFAASLLAAVGYAWLCGRQLTEATTLAARRTLVTASTDLAGPDQVLDLTRLVFNTVLHPLVFLIAIVFVVVLACECVQTGFVFSFEPLTPKFSKLNPANGLKRVFSLRQLIETAKNITKLATYTLLAVLAVHHRHIARHAQHLPLRQRNPGVQPVGVGQHVPQAGVPPIPPAPPIAAYPPPWPCSPAPTAPPSWGYRPGSWCRSRR